MIRNSSLGDVIWKTLPPLVLILIYPSFLPEKTMPFLKFFPPFEGREGKMTLEIKRELGGRNSDSFGKVFSILFGGNFLHKELARNREEYVFAKGLAFHFQEDTNLEFTPEELTQDFPLRGGALRRKTKSPALQNTHNFLQNEESESMPLAVMSASPIPAPETVPVHVDALAVVAPPAAAPPLPVETVLGDTVIPAPPVALVSPPPPAEHAPGGSARLPIFSFASSLWSLFPWNYGVGGKALNPLLMRTLSCDSFSDVDDSVSPLSLSSSQYLSRSPSPFVPLAASQPPSRAPSASLSLSASQHTSRASSPLVWALSWSGALDRESLRLSSSMQPTEGLSSSAQTLSINERGEISNHLLSEFDPAGILEDIITYSKMENENDSPNPAQSDEEEDEGEDNEDNFPRPLPSRSFTPELLQNFDLWN